MLDFKHEMNSLHAPDALVSATLEQVQAEVFRAEMDELHASESLIGDTLLKMHTENSASAVYS